MASWACTLAPFCTSSLIHPRMPLIEARCRGVEPLHVCLVVDYDLLAFRIHTEPKPIHIAHRGSEKLGVGRDHFLVPRFGGTDLRGFGVAARNLRVVFCLQCASLCREAGLLFSPLLPSGIQGPSSAGSGAAPGGCSGIRPTPQVASHSTRPRPRLRGRASAIRGPSQDSRKGRSLQSWELCTPGLASIGITEMKRKGQLVNELSPSLLIESRARRQVNKQRVCI